MKKLKILQFAMLLFTVTFFAACNDDDDDDMMDDDMVEACDSYTATYNGDVKAIINNSCAYSGCHSGADGSGGILEASRDFTTLSGIQASLDSGIFDTRALDLKNMPPSYAPEGSPTELTAEQLEILTCWKDAGYPEG